MSQKILVVDDEPNICNSVQDILEDEGFEVQIADSASMANTQIAMQAFDLVLLDIWMAPEDGISLLRQWKEQNQVRAPVVMMSGHGTVETAVEATRLGACGFIEKPLTMAKLLQVVCNNLKPVAVTEHSVAPGREFVGSSAVVRKLREDILRCATAGQHVFIRGEYGTGKQFIAENIHSQSTRSNAPFVVVAEGSGSDTFTRAGGGTLFLECEKIPPALAQSLKKKIDNGDNNYCVIFTTRDLSLTNTGLSAQLQALLSPLIVVAPPLRAYAEDIPEIIRASTDWHSQNDRKLPYRKFSIAAQNYLLHYEWPENLAELDYCVYRLLKDGTDEEVSPEEVKQMVGVSYSEYAWFEQVLQKPMREAREMFEKMYLKQLLEQVGGSVSRLAEKTDMERTHLYRKLRALGIAYKESKRHR